MEDFSLYEKVSPEVILKYQDKVPAELLEIWKDYGFGTFMNGYLKVINPDEYIELLQESYFRSDIAIPVMATAFGDIITWEKQQFVAIVEYRYSRNDIMIKRFDLFLRLLKDNSFKNRFFSLAAYDEAVSQYGHLGYNECFGYVPLLALGGAEKVENIKKVKLREHIAIIVDMAGGV